MKKVNISFIDTKAMRLISEKTLTDNKEIDYFIQNTQIHAYEWIFGIVVNLSEVKEIGKGGYGTVV